MRSPGKMVADEFYVHLSVLTDVQYSAIRPRIEAAIAAMLSDKAAPSGSN